MKARLVCNNEGIFKLLLADGRMKTAEKSELYSLLCCFKSIDKGFDGTEIWTSSEVIDITNYPGKTLAYITDNLDLVIKTPIPFMTLFDRTHHKSDYLSASEYAKKVGKSEEQIKVYCRKGRIKGAYKIGRKWIIPKDAPYPNDNRIKTGMMKRDKA